MAGYSETPLLKKLGIKQNDVLFLVNAPIEYEEWISPLPEGVATKIRPHPESVDFVHLFAFTKKQFETGFTKSKQFIRKNRSESVV